MILTPSGIRCKIGFIECKNKLVKEAKAGDKIGVNLQNVKCSQIRRGMMVSKYFEVEGDHFGGNKAKHFSERLPKENPVIDRVNSARLNSEANPLRDLTQKTYNLLTEREEATNLRELNFKTDNDYNEKNNFNEMARNLDYGLGFFFATNFKGYVKSGMKFYLINGKI